MTFSMAPFGPNARPPAAALCLQHLLQSLLLLPRLPICGSGHVPLAPGYSAIVLLKDHVQTERQIFFRKMRGILCFHMAVPDTTTDATPVGVQKGHF
jgi:hypothetical protein